MTRRWLALAGLLVVGGLLGAALAHQHDMLGALPPAATATALPTATPLPTLVPRATATPDTVHRAIPAAPRAVRASLPPDQAMPVDGPPSISAALIDATLAREDSPLAGLGSYIEAQGRRWRVDPVFLLAFVCYFDAPAPLANRLHNVGHIHAAGNAPSFDGYRAYATWRQGIDGWYRLIHDLYVSQWHLTTLDAILPVYAPGAGRHDVEAEINAMRGMIDAWRAMPH